MRNCTAAKKLGFPFFQCMDEHGSCWIIGVTLLAVLVTGLLTAKQAGESADLQMRRELVQQAVSIAAAANPSRIQELSFTAVDKDSPAFRQLCDQMAAYAEVAGIRSLYTMAMRDGQIVFGPESLPDGHPYASPPGTVYENPSQKDFDIFQTAQPQIQGPASDEYGTFVTASAPVIDPLTGEVVAVIGVDVDATDWQSAVRTAQWIPGKITLALMLVLILFSLILRIWQKTVPERRETLRHIEIVLCVIFMTALTAAVTLYFHQLEKNTRRNTFYALAQLRAATSVAEFNDMSNELDLLAAFFESSENISRAEFKKYCEGVMKAGGMKNCIWIPRVSAAEADEFIQSVRSGGLSGFSIWQNNGAGNRESVSFRPFYCPVLYIEPAVSGKVIGFDELSEPHRAAAIERALRTGLSTATDPICLVTSTNPVPMILVFKPVNASRQSGLVAFTIMPEKLLSGVHRNIRTRDLETCVSQLQAGRPPVLLAGSSVHCGGTCGSENNSELGMTVPIFRFGRAYGLRLVPSEDWLAANPLRNGLRSGFFGFLLTVLTSSIVGLITNRRVKLEKMVDRRTAELRSSEELLQESQAVAGLGSYVLDISSGIWTGSDVLDEIFGIDASYTHSVSDWTALVHPDDRAGMETYFKNEVLGCRQNFDREYRIIRHRDQVVRWVYGTGRLKDDVAGNVSQMSGLIQDITDRKQMEIYREVGGEVLELLNKPGMALELLLQRIVDVLRRFAGIDAVGIRLQEGDDFPYVAQAGFSAGFLRTENSLLGRAADGCTCRDPDGHVCLECTCGLVLTGKADRLSPLFSPGGSFWTNDSVQLLEIPPEKDVRCNPRNLCIHLGYASVALVPIHASDQIVGLLHLNDKFKGRFSPDVIHHLEEIASHIGEAMTRRQAEEKLRESEKRYDQLSEQNETVAWETDVNGLYTYCSHVSKTVFGYSPEEIVGKKYFYDLHPEDGREEFKAAAFEIFARNGIFQGLENRIQTPDGRIVWVRTNGFPILDKNGTLTGYRGSDMEITHRKLAADALRASEAKLELALRASGMGVWQWDIAVHRRIYDNQTCALLGLDPVSFKGTEDEFFSAIHPDDREKIREALIRSATANEPYETEYRAVRPDGSVHHIATRGRRFNDEQGNPLKITGICWDVTLDKLAEQKLKTSEERYQKLAQHLETVREDERKRLSRELHDDIGQILTALKIDLLMVHDGCSCGVDVKSKMDDMQRLLSEGIQSVHSLCHRLRPGALDDLGLDEALAALVSDWKTRNGIECRLFADLDSAGISDDLKTAVFRMVQEALTNVSRYAQAKNVEISLVADERMLNVSIADDGCGMKPGDAEKATSFGLMGMRERIEVLGGELHIESSFGKGTRIEASIPLSRGDFPNLGITEGY